MAVVVKLISPQKYYSFHFGHKRPPRRFDYSNTDTQETASSKHQMHAMLHETSVTSLTYLSLC